MRWGARALIASRGGLDRLEVGEFAYRSRRSLEALCWARAQPVYLGENEGLCRILGRYKLCVDTRDQGLCAHLLLDGFWEMGLTMYIARHVRDGMVAIDIGANEFGSGTLDAGEYPVAGTALSLVAASPIRGGTTVHYALPSPASVTLRAYDLQGRVVGTPIDREVQQAGWHDASLRADLWPAGCYFVRLTASGAAVTRRVVVLK